MERRAAPRYLMDTPIVCSHLSSAQSGKVAGGIMKNCGANGLYAELSADFKTGTVFVVRTAGSSGGYSREEGFHSLAIAEVKWSRPISDAGEVVYATGLKYVII